MGSFNKIFWTLCLLPTAALAQEFNLPLQNQYLADNPFTISSAFAGIGDCWQLRANGLSQWVGIDDSPNTQSIAIDGRIADRSGVGLILFNDSNGFTSQQGIQASFAHHLTLSDYKEEYLSFGISYRFTQFGINTSEFNRPDLGLRGDIVVNDHNFEVSTLYRRAGFFLNFSAVNLIDKELDEFGLQEPGNIRNYYIYTGYTFKPTFSDLEFEPSLFYQKFAGDTRGTSDINLKVRKQAARDDYFWGGASMRLINDQGFTPLYVAPMAGFKSGSLYAAYSYAFNVNQISGFSSGSHMITVGFDFGCSPSNCGCTY